MSDIVYKYRDWDNEYHKRMLTDNEVFMASPKDFNDSFDCRIFKNHLILDSDIKKNAFVEAMVEKHLPSIEQNLSIEEAKRKFLAKVTNIDSFQLEYENGEIEKMDVHNGVLSLSNRWDSILMWSHYGNNHRGISIGFNRERLEKSNLFSIGGNVDYVNDYPTINPLVDINPHQLLAYQTFHKAKDWSYEEEYRLAKLFFPMHPTNADRTIKIPDDCIEEVNLGMNVTDGTEKDILKIAKERGIRVYSVKRVPFKFELKREKFYRILKTIFIIF